MSAPTVVSSRGWKTQHREMAIVVSYAGIAIGGISSPVSVVICWPAKTVDAIDCRVPVCLFCLFGVLEHGALLVGVTFGFEI